MQKSKITAYGRGGAEKYCLISSQKNPNFLDKTHIWWYVKRIFLRGRINTHFLCKYLSIFNF
jgi:hypothetical protein